MNKRMSRASYNHSKKHNQKNSQNTEGTLTLDSFASFRLGLKMTFIEFYSAGKKLLDGDFVSTMWLRWILQGTCSGPRVPPFFTSCMCHGFLRMRASFVMLSTTRSNVRARKGVSFYFPACRFPVFLCTNCTSVYLVWQIHFFSDLEMYYAYGFVIKAMIICSSQTGVWHFGPALA